MAEVGRQDRQATLNIGALPVPLYEGLDRQAVPEVVQTWPSAVGLPVKCLKLPAHSPNLKNAYAERFVLSIKSECLDKIGLLGERHLRLAISEYVQHYHLERNHQGLDNQLITTPPTAATPANDNSPLARRERLGGLLNFYYRRAA